jgi:hypothetical protein
MASNGRGNGKSDILHDNAVVIAGNTIRSVKESAPQIKRGEDELLVAVIKELELSRSSRQGKMDIYLSAGGDTFVNERD